MSIPSGSPLLFDWFAGSSAGFRRRLDRKRLQMKNAAPIAMRRATPAPTLMPITAPVVSAGVEEPDEVGEADEEGEAVLLAHLALAVLEGAII